MSDMNVTVGGPSEGKTSRQFIDAWQRSERGEAYHEYHLAIESWNAPARCGRTEEPAASKPTSHRFNS
jgi:hypothetical protein